MPSKTRKSKSKNKKGTRNRKMKPVVINFPGGRMLWYERAEELEKHKYKRPEYFKNRELTKWRDMKADIERKYNYKLQDAYEAYLKKKADKAKEEADKAKKEAEKAKKEAEKAKANKKPRCKKGTRRNKKTGKCEPVAPKRK